MCYIVLLLPSKFEVNRLKHARVIAKKQKMGDKYKENWMNFDGTYLSDG